VYIIGRDVVCYFHVVMCNHSIPSITITIRYYQNKFTVLVVPIIGSESVDML
jgi:hypothetical protein